MKENIQVVIITVVLFLGGLLTGVWTQKTKPAPPPPMPFLGELAGGKPGDRMPPPSDSEIKAMQAEAEKMKPQREAFENKLRAIQDDARAKIGEVLKPDQKAKFEEFKKGHAGPSPSAGGPPPFPGPEFLGLVMYKPQLDRITSDLGLDASQRGQVEEILRVRRQAVMELLDNNPPPSLMIGKRPGGPGEPSREPGMRPPHTGPTGPEGKPPGEGQPEQP